MAKLAPRASLRVAGSRQFTEILYTRVWKKSTIRYLAYVAAGCVVVDVAYDAVGNSIWEANNKGVS